MAKTLSPLVCFVQSKVRSYQGRSDTPFIDGLRDAFESIWSDISPELSQTLVTVISESTAETQILKRSVSRNIEKV